MSLGRMVEHIQEMFLLSRLDQRLGNLRTLVYIYHVGFFPFADRMVWIGCLLWLSNREESQVAMGSCQVAYRLAMYVDG